MKMHTIVLGITGGIAAVKIPNLIKVLLQKKIRVIPIMTQSAAKIISSENIEKIAGEKVYLNLFLERYSTSSVLSTRRVEHIDIADKADLVVVAPATANVIAKVGNGIADDFLTTTILATQAPILLCPSMNVHMWHNQAVQKNIIRCRGIGYHVLPPEHGSLACGYEGEGRLPEIETIITEIEQLLNRKNLLKNKRILVTSGGTVEPVDDVRVITNRSSGKMGAAIADACFSAGASVTLLRAEQSVYPKYSVTTDVFQTVDDLQEKLEHYLPSFDVCFHLAAVSDFAVKKIEGKISSALPQILRLNPREKIYQKIKQINSNIILITFKAESNLSNEQWDKELRYVLRNSQIDAVIGNDIGKVGQGFQSDMNAAIALTRDGKRKKFALTSKRFLAEEILQFLFDST